MNFKLLLFISILNLTNFSQTEVRISPKIVAGIEELVQNGIEQAQLGNDVTIDMAGEISLPTNLIIEALNQFNTLAVEPEIVTTIAQTEPTINTIQEICAPEKQLPITEKLVADLKQKINIPTESLNSVTSFIQNYQTALIVSATAIVIVSISYVLYKRHQAAAQKQDLQVN